MSNIQKPWGRNYNMYFYEISSQTNRLLADSFTVRQTPVIIWCNAFTQSFWDFRRKTVIRQ